MKTPSHKLKNINFEGDNEHKINFRNQNKKLMQTCSQK